MKRKFIIEENSFPDLPKLMLATIEALNHIGGSASIQELDESVIELEGVSEDEQAIMMPNGRYQRLNYYLAWARTYLKRGGALINSSRGVWALTELGENIKSLDRTVAIWEQVNEEEKQRAKDKRLATKPSKKDKGQSVELPSQYDDNTSIEHWRTYLLDTLKSMDPTAFERLSQRLLREAGFLKVEVRGKTGDGGIDGIGILRVNLVSFQVYFQCKRYKGSVGSKEIRDFRGALQGRADKGLFITTGHFTSQASEEATRDGAIAIDLIDGDRLCDLLKQYDLGVSTSLIEKIEIDKHWFGTL